MTVLQSISPTTQILDDAGRDWAWMFVLFRPVARFPFYAVGSNGSVWGCQKRGSGSGVPGPWRRLNPTTSRGGYHAVTLCNGPIRRRVYVHVLILETFVGPCPEGMEARHYPDRDVTNNAIRNIRWGTAQENADDRREHGTVPRGECQWRAKLTADDIMSIRRRVADGESMYSVAKEYSVNDATIYDAVRRRTWAHVPDEA